MPRMNTAAASQTPGRFIETRPSAAAAMANTTVRVCTPPNRSARKPPKGRTIEPEKTQAAVTKPAVTDESPYSEWK